VRRIRLLGRWRRRALIALGIRHLNGGTNFNKLRNRN